MERDVSEDSSKPWRAKRRVNSAFSCVPSKKVGIVSNLGKPGNSLEPRYFDHYRVVKICGS